MKNINPIRLTKRMQLAERNEKIRAYYKKRMKETGGRYIMAIVDEIANTSEFGSLTITQVRNIIKGGK